MNMDNHTVDPMTKCSVTNSTSGSAVKPEAAADDVTRLLWTVCGPTLLVLGVVGNVLILVTVTQRRMRGSSTFVYLSAMAVIDLLVLVTGFTFNWLEGAGYVTVKKLSPAACKMEKFLDYTTGDAAIWCRVAFTLDRLVAVLMPLYTGRACGRPMSARLYVIIASVAAVAKNAHVLVTRGAEYKRLPVCGTTHYQTTLVDVCGYTNKQFSYFEQFVRPWLAFALVTAAPFLLIAVCNSLIVVALVRRRHKMSARLSAVSQNEQHLIQLTVMCVAASALFLVCTLPSILMLIGKPYWNVPKGKNPAYQVWKAVSNILFYVTFSANFFLYCMSGHRFRVTLRRVLCRWFCCVDDARQSRLTAASTRTWTATQRHATTLTVTALPNTVNDDPQLKPVGSDARLVSTGDDRLTTVTSFTDHHHQSSNQLSTDVSAANI